ncbi:MAG: hypothetical protein ACLFVX_04430 [Archaeoglobaceae archaeon]
MRTSKLVIFFLALVAIGFLALPSTVSLFAGQHYWYNLEGSGSDIPCKKCHADIYAEMDTHVGPHSGETYIDSAKYSPGGHQSMGNFPCFYCHTWYYTNNQHASVEGTTVVAGEEAHAASTVSCIACHRGQEEVYTTYESWDPNWGEARLDGPAEHEEYCNDQDSCVGGGCHDDPSDWDEFPEHGIDIAGVEAGIPDGHCKRCHCNLEPGGSTGNYESYSIFHVPPATGFGITYFNQSGAYGWDTGSMAAHKAFVDRSRDTDILRDENEACIACHTGIAVKINWTHARTIEFDIGVQKPVVTDAGTHNWTVDNWDYSGTANATSWGNTTGFGNSTIWNEWPGDIDQVYD